MTNSGSYLGNYRLLAQLPQAAHEDIYVAEHTNLTGSPVLIRVWRTADFPSAEEQDAFLQELHTLTQLQHVHILPFLESGRTANDIYLVTAYHQPPLETLRQQIERLGSQQMPAHEALKLINEIGQALQYAHHHNVIHRQLTPDRILLGPVGSLLSDFGLMHTGETTLRKQSQPMKLHDQYVYMAPEQLQNQIGPASDQYALGAIAYELYTGQQPYPAPQTLVPPETLNPTLSPAIAQAISTAMATFPSERHPDVATFINTLLNASQTTTDISEQNTIAVHPAPELIENDTVRPNNAQAWEYIQSSTAQSVLEEQQTGPQPVYAAGTFQPISEPISNPQFNPMYSGMQYSGQYIPHYNTPPPPSGARQQKLREFMAKRGKLLAIILLIVLIPPLIFYGLTILPASAATLTITPISKRLTQTYAITAVNGTPNSALYQAPGYLITFTTPAKTKTVPVSGRGHQNATAAKGILTFSQVGQNSNIQTGQTLTGFDGIQIITDQAFSINVGQTVDVPAHAVNAGSCCNIGAFDINYQADVIDVLTRQTVTTVFVANKQPFKGGQNAFNYNFVKQSDIDGVANSFVDQLTKDAQAGVEKQVKPNQQPATDMQCKPNVKPNHKVNDRVDIVTVNVTVTCSREYFVPQEVQNVALYAFQNDAQTQFGSNYILSGNAVINAPTTGAQLSDGNATFQVKVDGIWYYHFSDSQQQQIIQNILGKSQSNANNVLTHTPGVSKAVIATSGGIGWALPTSPPSIKFVAVNIPGLQAG
jgi:serine/threonine protein kinase